MTICPCCDDFPWKPLLRRMAANRKSASRSQSGVDDSAVRRGTEAEFAAMAKALLLLLLMMSLTMMKSMRWWSGCWSGCGQTWRRSVSYSFESSCRDCQGTFLFDKIYSSQKRLFVVRYSWRAPCNYLIWMEISCSLSLSLRLLCCLLYIQLFEPSKPVTRKPVSPISLIATCSHIRGQMGS